MSTKKKQEVGAAPTEGVNPIGDGSIEGVLQMIAKDMTKRP